MSPAVSSAACGLSFLYIVLRVAYRFILARKGVAYKVLVNEDEVEDDSHVVGPADGEEGEETDPMLLKATQAERPHLEIDRPRGEIATVALEVAALVGVLTTIVIVLDTNAWGDNGTLPAVGKLVSWGYIMILVLVRFTLSTLNLQSTPRLWSHTAALYAIQWLLNVFVFRSAVIHPISKRALTLSAVEFSLSTLLLLIALTTRRGNKAVWVQYEDGLEPPRHPKASLLSLVTFNWLDPLIWKGYSQPLELDDIWNLTTSQKAATVLEDFRRQQTKGSLVWRLGRYFYGTLLVQGAWTVFSNLFTYLPTLLLKAILEYVEDPRSTTANAAWLYAILLFCSGAIQGVADGQALWIGRKLGVKLRAIIIGEIYAKALRRKAGASLDAPKKKTTEEPPKDGKKSRIFSFGRKKKKATTDSESDTPNQSEAEKIDPSKLANVGTIINLMAIDSFKVSEVGAYLHFLWASVPVQIIIAVTLLYRLLGFSSFAGIVLMVLMLPVNLFIAKGFARLQNQILAGTDARIHSTNEVLQNIRIVKYFAWEQRFEDIIDEKRRAELKSLRSRYILWSFAATVWYGTPILITFTSFFLYTVVEKKKLTPSVAFPALSMFSLLRVPLDQLADMVAHVQESKVSLDRVDKYLHEEETEKYIQLSRSANLDITPKIALENATLSWGTPQKDSSRQGTTDSREAFRLINIDVEFRVGKLNIIAGPTGSGKTSLLMALLGEMKLLDGNVHLPGGTANRTELPVDPQTGLIESVAYCAQEAWLVNATVKENIVFASPFDERRYKAVIKACALERDLAILDAGDQTLVGEKGISLSGGQKQRISLARAIYSRARHILLDDCLSAVDSHTAKHIFREALTGPLMMDRTCVLVTHNVALTVPQADFVIVLDNGKVSAQGRPEDVASSGAFGDDYFKSVPASRASTPHLSRRQSDSEEGQVDDQPSANGKVNGSTGKQNDENSQSKLTESKAVGSIKWSTIQLYLRSMGPWYYWITAALVFSLQQFGSVSTNLWIRQWANSYQIKDIESDDAGNYAAATSLKFPSFNAGGVPRTSNTYVPQFSGRWTAATDRDVNVSYYLGVYALLGIGYVLISLFREGVLFWGSLNASSKIHRRLLDAVMHAKFKFFDSTPLGQLMNRFSKDIEAVDQEVAPVAIGMLHCLASVIMIVVLISIITPGFLIAAIFITMVYFALGAVYLNASRDMKRLESVQRSPLYQQFGETLNGIVTIRAYGDGPRFIIDNHRRINAYNRPHIYLWASNRWLAFRVDITGALVSFFTATFVLINVGKIDAGAAGLSLTYAVTFTENVLWLVRLYSEVQQSMNSVERVKEYLDVEQEAKAVIPDSRPPADWPSGGAVDFIDYTTRYRSDLDPVLRNVSFAVKPGEKVGIVGRTGAGKSSLALALFRGLEAEEGKIVIDGLDIGSIGLRDLREAITIVPQDPTLFTGSIRTNLDPFNLFSDEQMFTALRRVHLIGPETSGTATPVTAIAPTNAEARPAITNGAGVGVTGAQDNKNVFRNLESPVSESGSNLSQGQRQLLCLARALLKNPKVLMMDEATASIDYNTDSKIQETLRELRDSTIITIAHRLQTIIDYDKVLVLDHGRVIEYDHPWTLINKPDGLFRSMCENSGNFETLLEGAKKAWEAKRLVDDS
ncbi:putative ABC bile acid transporter [Aspergillus clavatus NRRL 1]|uniref:ATP-dependent bile acid permease n=1 Tax=Aspergillus clavatus (strain ATCC 1007 / CBS 513.65 / DSM 816 / NCTC 3887 / NRRL 1 / QM 1276 / 107) TaxID=344612 RepID=A1CAE3_ASPCL|nr:ATP-dependent bile acid permease [Aspergillus clavatus NRRL 1]EAW12711.1 ATP-dependent bile acid permease [Aspergillus clavatus NRRL 1]